MGETYDRVCSWENLRLAHHKAARGKRGRRAAATFEYNLADRLIELRQELLDKSYRPGGYSSFYIHQPKRRLISAAPFRDRVVHHALCNVIEPIFERLRGIGGWLGRRVPYATYGALCGLSLWPLVEAAQGQGVLPVMMALGSVAGGVGGNLIAEQIQRWADRADEGTVVEWVGEQAPQDGELRQALDEILERLEALPAAQAGLGEADRRRFAETLRNEMAALGNLPRFEAHLEGSGAIAQGEKARAVGRGGVLVEGDVRGDVVTGSRHTVFDQRGQRVRRQINVAGDWKGDEAEEGD